MRPTLIKVAAWGAKHNASLRENILPCLLAPGNLPALCAKSPTELILCSNELFQFPPWPISGLTVKHRLLQDLPPPGDLPANRRVLARTDSESVHAAMKVDADWFSFQADTLVSDGFLPRVKELLHTHLAVAGSPVRTDLAQLRAAVGASRAFSAAELQRLSMKCLHPVTADYFVRDPPTTIPADPHQLLFRTPEGFVARTWQFCPFGISREGLGLIDLCHADADDETIAETTIDCYLVQNLPPQRVRFHDPQTDDFYLTSVDEGAIPTFGAFPVTAAGIANSMSKFSRDYADLIYYGIALRQRFAYKTDIPLPNSLGEQETLAAIMKVLRP